MKEKILEILFILLVILLTPIYLLIYLSLNVLSLLTEMTSPFVEGIIDFIDEMIKFWKKFFKIGG